MGFVFSCDGREGEKGYVESSLYSQHELTTSNNSYRADRYIGKQVHTMNIVRHFFLLKIFPGSIFLGSMGQSINIMGGGHCTLWQILFFKNGHINI